MACEISIDLPVDHVVTLTSKTGQVKGGYDSPPSQPFPVPYEDDFDSMCVCTLGY